MHHITEGYRTCSNNQTTYKKCAVLLEEMIQWASVGSSETILLNPHEGPGAHELDSVQAVI